MLKKDIRDIILELLESTLIFRTRTQDDITKKWRREIKEVQGLSHRILQILDIDEMRRN